MSEVLKAMGDWHRRRHRARTDLLWLCNWVLGYDLISERVHGPILAALQKFPGAIEHHKTEQDFAAALQGKLMWEPKVPLPLLESNGQLSKRKLLILFPRGHAKSTIATVAHSVQWIINYPNVRILLTTATEDLGIDFIKQIKEHFLINEKFRYLFPELCPKAMDNGKVPEMGNQTEFTIPGRDNTNKKLGPGGKDETCRASTVGSAITGYHGDVFKADDMVEKINSGTPTGIQSVIYHFGTMEPMLEDYVGETGKQGTKGWIDLIGTPWDYSDLYQTIRANEENLPAERRTWNIVVRSAAPNWPEGPYLWPEKKGYEQLKEVEDDPTQGPSHLAAQYLMNPIVSGQGLIDDLKAVIWVPRKEMDDILPRLTLFAALDLAGMDSESRGGDNDYTVLSVGGFNTDGRLYIPEIRYGRPTTDEVIEWVFDVFRRYPRLIKLKVEKEAHARVLLPFMKKEMQRRQQFLSIEAQPRSNQQSKKDKIKGLRPWFVNGDIRFAQDLPCRTALETEIKGFPKFRHDDILDTLTDLMFEGKDVNSAVMGRDKPDYVPEFKKLADGTKVNIPQIPLNKPTVEQIFGELYAHSDIFNPFTGFRQ
jgi:predicted phage terminase large subunit-like protein